jgi:hypothetical protein
VVLGEAQKAANRRGIKWDSEKELAETALLAEYSGIPAGLAWQFRKWENGAKIYAWGQIGYKDALMGLFEPTRRQPAQAVRTLRIGTFWWAVAWASRNPVRAREALARIDWSVGLPDALVLTSRPENRGPYAKFLIEKAWKARAGRSGQYDFVLAEWNAWDEERGVK